LIVSDSGFKQHSNAHKRAHEEAHRKASGDPTFNLFDDIWEDSDFDLPTSFFGGGGVDSPMGGFDFDGEHLETINSIKEQTSGGKHCKTVTQKQGNSVTTHTHCVTVN
jgi:hypothetical protein